MDEKVQKQSIYRLDINENVTSILESNSINTLGELCRKTESDLKKLDVGENEIEHIEMELQMLGLSLRNRV